MGLQERVFRFSTGFLFRSKSTDFMPLASMAGSKRTLLVAKGIATRSKGATRGAPGIAISSKKLVGWRPSLLPPLPPASSFITLLRTAEWSVLSFYRVRMGFCSNKDASSNKEHRATATCGRTGVRPHANYMSEDMSQGANALHSAFRTHKSNLLLVAMPGSPSSVLAPSSKARSP